MTNHPITPPPELVEEWFNNSPIDRGLTLATQAAQWGADQELEATLGLMGTLNIRGVDYIRNARRPTRRPTKPPSLKEQALSELNLTADPDGAELSRTQVELIRKALESL